MAWSRFFRIALAVIVVAAVAAMAGTILWNRPSSVPQRPVASQMPPNIDVALRKARFTEVLQGNVVWELVADRAEYDKQGETAFLTGITMEFAGNGPPGKISLRAASGQYSTKTRNVSLRGDVLVQTANGARFRSQQVDYVAEGFRLITRETVVFEHQRLALTAVGMEMDIRRQVARFGSKVDASVKGF